MAQHLKENNMPQHKACYTCKFFENLFPEGSEEGWCRRYPPVLIDKTEDDSILQWSFPYMEPTNWCGEWKLG